jgi:AraC-like DNA-binding protein
MEYFNYNISPSLDVVTNGKIGREWRQYLPEAPYSRIYLPLDGEASFKIDNTEYIIKPDYAYLIPTGTRMLTYCRDFCQLFWVHYHIKTDFTDNFFAIFPYEVQRESKEQDHVDMETLLELQNSRSMHDVLIRNAILQRFTASFLKPGRPDAMLPRFAAALRKIEAKGENLSVAELAKKCGMSPPYFSSLFKKTFGIPPQRYIIRAKINAAIPLLMNNCTLDEIAEQLGFHDAFHLSKTFKRVIGCSPRQYKKQMLETDAMP